LHRLDILDTEPEQQFDDIASLASFICGTPIALISLIDENRQWFKSTVGMTEREMPRDISFCAHGILHTDVFVVEDAQLDERFASNPLVTGEAQFRFYAGSPLVTSDGHAIGMICVIDQVPRELEAERKKALQALARQVVALIELRRAIEQKNEIEAQSRALVDALCASELSYRRLFEAAQDGVLILEVETGQVTDVNPYLTSLLGYAKEEMIGKTVGELSPFEDLEANKLVLQKVQREGYARYFNLPLQTRDGQKIDVEVVSNLYPVGNKNVIQCNIRDITERKKAEEQLTLLNTCVSRLNDAIIIAESEQLDEPGPKIIFANKAFERITGYAPDEVIGRSPRLLQGEKTDPKVLKEIRQALVERQPIQRQLINYTKSGAPYWIEMDIVPIFNAAGKCTHFVAIQRDITEKKKLEAQFMRAQRMESIGTLAGGIAHDLNNILAPILMSIDILKNTADDPESREVLDTIETSAKRGSDIVRQVLSFARGVEGEKVEVQPKHLLQDLEKIIRETFPKNIQLKFVIPRETWTILGDPTQMHQVLLNLCVNARDALPSGGNLTVGIENTTVDAQYAAMNIEAKPGRYVQIYVTDTGTGIPPSLLEKIFEPFFTTKEVNKGTGLGLSTVSGIVKSHGGFISVYSELGKGSTFKVYFPAMESSAERRTTQTKRLSFARGNGETILIVDDEASIRTITGQTLAASGYRVLKAADGAEALAVYAGHKDEIAVVLTDMMMPVMDGHAFIHALRRMNPEVRIIAASGLNADGTVTRVTASGVKHFLTKPYTAATLLKTLHEILHETPESPSA
jgi:PAS domain S-box-containing protein